MTHYFFDSSALTKRYVAEVGSGWVRTTTAIGTRHSILLAHIAPIEMTSAMMRRFRAGSMSLSAAQQARHAINYDAHHRFTLIDFNAVIEQLAQDLLERHPLRSLDALQLASAMAIHARLIRSGLVGVVFVTADQRLLSAAIVEGLTTDDPSLHP